MKKKILSVLLCAAMVTSMAVGCSSTSEETSGSEEQTETDADSKDGTIYLLHKGLDYYAWTAMQEAFDKYVQDLGYDYQILNAENDVSKQVEQFKTTLTQDPKAIIVTAIDSESLVDCVKEANDAGIPVGVYDTPITGGDVDITVDCDNKMAGQQAAEMIVEALKEKNGSESGKVLNVFGDLSSQVMQERKQGFDDVMAQYPDIEVIEASGMGDRQQMRWQPMKILMRSTHLATMHLTEYTKQ